jgi:pimeloyl-ACP methyl ester carboxylesterase
MPYTRGRATSRDGTPIGYRRLGAGPGLVLVHGGMQAAQNFMTLARLLGDTFTVHVPDRRGRGASGPYGDDYTIERDCEDLRALLAETGAHHVFGLSSGALISMKTALGSSAIHRLALYEPPLPIPGASLTDWIPRYEEELRRGDLAAAMVSVIKGTGDVGALETSLPRFLLVPLLRLAIRVDEKRVQGDDVPISALIPTMRYDALIVGAQRGTLDDYRALSTEVLLLGGSKSHVYLRATLDALSTVLPNARRVELPGVGHIAADNTGKPEIVAAALRRFFGAPPGEVGDRAA